ncbi:MAG: nitroreductase [Sandaracinaceae bacterium]|nr:nitroreductase [Sandaracinaceae bacterium]
MMNVHDALHARYSVRGFKPDPIPQETLRELFEDAQRTPSWCNIQPWRVWVTSGDATRRLTAAMLDAATKGLPQPEFPWPAIYPEPYDALRRACGKALYEAMGIARDDKAGRLEAWRRNYAAFDAPHAVIVGMDRRFDLYAAIDIGCWLQSILLGATARGIATCPQAALATYPAAVRSQLAIPDELGLLFGIALGYEDPSVPANACRTDRSPLEHNVQFVE